MGRAFFGVRCGNYTLSESPSYPELTLISITDGNGDVIPGAILVKKGGTLNLTGSSAGGKSGVKDPMSISLFDLNDKLLFSTDFFDDEAGVSDGAGILWDENGMLLSGSAIGEAHYSYSKAQPIGPAEVGSVSITNNVFTTTGSFASMPWSVYSVGGITNAFLPNSYLETINEFDPTSLATSLFGMPNVKVKWAVGSTLNGSTIATSFCIVPEPGAIAFSVLAAGSVIGLIARKRNG